MIIRRTTHVPKVEHMLLRHNESCHVGCAAACVHYAGACDSGLKGTSAVHAVGQASATCYRQNTTQHTRQTHTLHAGRMKIISHHQLAEQGEQSSLLCGACQSLVGRSHLTYVALQSERASHLPLLLLTRIAACFAGRCSGKTDSTRPTTA